jgi:heme/copper-type cytochrome/quinol oxidase subunit 3
MPRIVSGRAEKTDQVVVLPSSLEDASKSPPGLYRIGLLAICLSIFAFFTALVIAYLWRSNLGPYAPPIRIPRTLWISTALILASSITFEIARRMFRRGNWRVASRLVLTTASLGAGFWRRRLQRGVNYSRAAHFMCTILTAQFFYLVYRITRSALDRRHDRDGRSAVRPPQTPRADGRGVLLLALPGSSVAGAVPGAARGMN